MWASKSYTFSPSTVASSSEVNQNFDDMVAGLNTAMPSGMVCMWSGSVGTIPAGWFLCDGSNSTPDLRGQFVLGAGGAYAVGATGGAATHTLTASEMPSHTHTIPADGGTDNSGGPYARFDGGASGTVTSNSAGSGAAHNNMPPYYALCFVMKS